MKNLKRTDITARYKGSNGDMFSRMDSKFDVQKYPKNTETYYAVSDKQSGATRHTDPNDLSKNSAQDNTKISVETRAKIWAMILRSSKHSTRLAADDNEILSTALNLPNQRVIKNDCSRTRVSQFDDSMKTSLEYLLTYYCKKENISYKQGLNEVAAPFITFMKSNLQISTVYNYFAMFMEKFLPNIFTDHDFLSMQCSFRILNILLRYHDPQLFHFLKINDLPPELYATPWFLTLFASKLSLDMVFLLWDAYMIENDECFLLFICLALLHLHKAKILATDPSMVPQTLTTLTLEHPEDLRTVLKKAYELRAKTPESFTYFIRGLDIFARDYNQDTLGKKKMQFNVDYLSRWDFFFMQPLEIIKYLNPRRIQCSNPLCPSNTTSASKKPVDSTKPGYFNLSNDEFNRSMRERKSIQDQSGLSERIPTTTSTIALQCEFCGDRTRKFSKELQASIQTVGHMREVMSMSATLSRQELDFFIIDLRIDRNREDGMIPKSQVVDIKHFTEDAMSKLIDDLIELRNEFHFCFMIDSFDSTNMRNTDSSEILNKFVNYFIDNGFSHISILEGGFRMLHDLSLRMESDILFHNKTKCKTCQGKRSEEWPMRSSIMGLFNQVFRDAGRKINELGLFTEIPPKQSKIKQTVSLSPTHYRRQQQLQINPPSNVSSSKITLNTQALAEHRKIQEESDRSYLSGEENIDSSRHSTLKPHQIIDSSQISPSQLLTTVISSSRNDTNTRNPPTQESVRESYKDHSESTIISRALASDQPPSSQSFSKPTSAAKGKRSSDGMSNTQSPIRRSQIQTFNASRYVFTTTTGPSGRKELSSTYQRVTSPDIPSKAVTYEYKDNKTSKTFRPLTSSAYITSTSSKPTLTPKSDSFKNPNGSAKSSVTKSSQEESLKLSIEPTGSDVSDRNRGKNPPRERVQTSEFKIPSVVSISYTGTPNNQFARSNVESGAVTTVGSKNMLSPRDIQPRREGAQQSMPNIDDKSQSSEGAYTTSTTTFRGKTGPAFMYNSGANLGSERESLMRRTASPSDNGTAPANFLKGVAKNIPLHSNSKVKMEGDMDYFKLNGIRRSISLESQECLSFFKLLELYPKVTLFLADFVKASSGTDDNKGISKSEARAKRILVLTRDLFFSVDYDAKLYEYLKFVEEGVGSDRVMQLISNSDSKISLSPSKRASIQSSTSNSQGYAEQGKGGFMITIRAMFPIKFLLRITSKKYDSSYLSFYFKVPNVDSLQLEQYKAVLDRFSKGSLRLFFELARDQEFLDIIKQVLEKKDGKEMSQSKHLYVIEGEAMAKECISSTRNYYNEASTALVKKRHFTIPHTGGVSTTGAL